MSCKSYHLATARRLVEDRQRLDAQIHVPLIQALEKLKDDSYRVERVQAKETGAWRLRLADWRIRDDIVGNDIHLLRARHRREVYRQDRDC